MRRGGCALDADDCTDAAATLGARLCDDAVWHAGRAAWTGDLPAGTDPGAVVHRSVGGDLYTGTSGIGWFLAHLWRATGRERVRRTARGALVHALARTSETVDAGLLTGWAGVALAVISGAVALEDDTLTAQGVEYAADALARSPDVDGADLTAGAAGVVLALLALRGHLGTPAVDAANRLADTLVDTAEDAVLGRTWASPVPEPPLCGLAHGASGPALALLELGCAVEAPEATAAALEALDYERAWFNRSVGGWPDLRGLSTAPVATVPTPVFWCHGSAGIGLARLDAWRRTGRPRLIAEAAAAVDHATAGLLRALPAGGANLSLCHGVGSVAELHLVAADATGVVEHVDHARTLVARGLSRKDGDWRDTLTDVPCGVTGGGETPGLFLGLAGVGATLLRLGDPRAAPSPALPHHWLAPPAPPGC